MKDNQAKYPQLRFKGFTNPWEQRKLGELADIVGGGTPSTNNDEYWNGDIDWYSPVEINNQIYVSGSKNKITELGLQKSSAKVLPIGTVLFTSRAGIGKTAILAKKGTTNQGFQSILPHENKLDSYFIFSRTDELKRYGETNGAGSTFVEVSGKQMSKMPIMLPKIEEQMRIGTFFQQLDNLITLHQRKLNKLKKLKSAYLTEMFPAEGERKPKRRFAGFTDAWEQRKISDVAERLDNLRIPVKASKRKKGIIPYYGANGIQDYVEGFTHNGENVLIAEDGANDIDNYPVRFVKGKIWVNNHAHVLKSYENTTDNRFLAFALKRTKIDKYLVGGSRAKLNADTLMNISIMVPSLEEQKIVGSLFVSMDHLITLHQRKIDKLKKLKDAYLNEMFV